MVSAADLERRLTSSDGQQHLNEISSLFEQCESEDLRVVATALQAIARVLAHHRRLSLERTPVNKELVIWLQKHGEAFHALLHQLAGSGEPRAQVCAVRLAFAVLRDEATEMLAASRNSDRSDPGKLFGLRPPERQIQELLDELLLAEKWNGQVADCLVDEFVKPYADVRQYVTWQLRSCAEQLGKAPHPGQSGLPKKEELQATEAATEAEAAAAETSAKRRKRQLGPFAELAVQRGRSHEELFARLLALLEELPEPQPSGQAMPNLGAVGSLWADEAGPEDLEEALFVESGKPAGYFKKEYRRQFQEAWLKLLGLRVPLAHCSPLLQLLPNRVMPHLSRPLMLSDFYLRAFHAGSVELGVLALSGLLLLLTSHGLGDPETLSSSCGEFYSQLYSLLQPATFRLERRARFQRLAAAALTSALLPARFAAAFAKKCIRVAIACAEPGAIMWLLAVAYGLIQRNHSHCAFLLHREAEDTAHEALTSGKDPFRSEDSLKDAAEQVSSSSLWEIQLLLRHHLPAVATLAKLFEKPFFKPTARKLDPELFLDQSTNKCYEQALKAADRQVTRWKARGEKCPLAYQLEDDELAMRVTGWVAGLSTGQRRVGAGI